MLSGLGRGWTMPPAAPCLGHWRLPDRGATRALARRSQFQHMIADRHMRPALPEFEHEACTSLIHDCPGLRNAPPVWIAI